MASPAEQHSRRSSQDASGSQANERIPRRRIPLVNRRGAEGSSQVSIADHELGNDTTAPRTGPLVDENNEDFGLVVMAVDVKDRGTVGCAYYIAQEERLLCMDDVQRGGDILIQTLTTDIRPTILLMPPRVDPAPDVSDPTLRARIGSLVDDNEEVHFAYELAIRPASEFSVEGAKNKLVNLDSIFERTNSSNIAFLTPGDIATFERSLDMDDSGFTRRQGRLLKLSAWIGLDNTTSIGCVGAVLAFLQRRRASQYLQDDPDAQEAYKVQTVEMFSLNGTMFISAETLLSLQILQPEFHPNFYNQGPGTAGSKESLSVYGLFRHLARSPQGKTTLRQHFLRPLQDISSINGRLDFITVLTRPENETAMKKMSKNFSKMKNLRPIMVQLHKGINIGNNKFGGFKSGVWATLLDVRQV